jgi:hypothetical protein
MAMTTQNLNEMLNLTINKALGAGLTITQIAAALTAQSALVTALTTTYTHDRTIQDPGAGLNPSLPQPP